MSTPASIFDRAQLLCAEARRLGDSEIDRENAARVENEITNAHTLLDGLEELLQVVELLREQGIDVDTGPVDTGLDRFARHAGNGVPSPKAATAARKALEEVKARVSERVIAAWFEWANGVVSAIPTDRVYLLDQARAKQVQADLTQLRALRGQKAIDPDVIARFDTLRNRVARALENVEDPGPHLRTVLQEVQHGTTLDQLSDDDIAVLRQRGWAKHIIVKREDFD